MQLFKIQIPRSIISCINFLMIFDEIGQNELRHGDLSLVELRTCSGEQMEKSSKDLCFLQRSSAAACSWNTLGSSAHHSGSIWLQWGSKFILFKLRIVSPLVCLSWHMSLSGLVCPRTCLSMRVTQGMCPGRSYATDGMWTPKCPGIIRGCDLSSYFQLMLNKLLKCPNK